MPTVDEVVQTFYPTTLAALTVWREARGESYPAKLAVARVLHNRASDPRWPNTLDEVALQPLQFSSFNKLDPNAVKFPHRTNHADWESFLECVQAVIDSESQDPIEGANHYYDISISPPRWTSTMTRVGQVGRLVFYRG